MGKMRVLCFGASLVEGYTFQPDGSFYPYSKRLKELLSEHCKAPVEMDTMGVSGEKVINSMSKRLDRTLKESKQPYNWIMILGGTNDLGYKEKSDDIVAALCHMHDRARETGARTLALALPQFSLEDTPGCKAYKEEKAKVNDGLREYCEASHSQSVFVDLHGKLPHTTLGQEEKRKYWCDDLHMTPLGYDRMAEVVFDTLKEYV